ncbi:MAG: hypothetical protein JXA99_02045 [Candidatus Lokiarchaeota archaeon]|jgi:hypothetical protein|nr:hypothetical protein [Candidatus Lokiarchaeota archaeon]
MVNESGNNGPTIRKVFFCTDCKYLKDGGAIINSKCMHDDILNKDLSSWSFLVGEIKPDKMTPSICPFLMQKMREEKLKEINESK